MRSVSAQTITPLGSGTQYSIGYCIAGGGGAAGGVQAQSDADKGFRWRASDGMMTSVGSLGFTYSSYSQGMSDDGAVVVGYSGSVNGNRAFRWTQAGGMTNLGVITGGFNSWAGATSADGTIIAGSSDFSTASSSRRAIRWINSGMTMQVIGTLPGGTNAVGTGLSADGSVMVGYGSSTAGERAFRWTQATGMASMGVTTGAPSSRAWGVNSDGSVVVGFSGNLTTFAGHAFRWTAAGGMEDLGAQPGTTYSVALGVSGDGSIVVGTNANAAFQSRAMAWSRERGMVDLNTFLPTVRVDLTDWLLYDAYGISRDGTAIAGSGKLGATVRGFIIRGLPASVFHPCRADFNNAGGLEVQDIFDFINAWLAGDLRADFNLADGIGVQDIFDFLNAWLAGC